MKIIKAFYILTLLFIPFGEIVRIDLGENTILKPLDLSVGLTAIIFIVYCIKNRYFPKNSLTKPVILFSAIGILSLIINFQSNSQTHLLVASLYLIRWIAYAIIFFVLISFDKNFKEIISKILFIVGFLILLGGYVQFFLYPNLRNLYYLGWDEHNYRMFSAFLDPNFAGAFFVLFFLFLLGAIHFYVRSKKYRDSIILASISLVTLIAIFLTYSRSAILMLVFGVATYLIFINKKRFLAIFFGIIIFIIILLSPTLNKENTNLLRITSSVARIGSYTDAIKIIQYNPILGVGFDAYRYAKESYGFSKSQTKYPSHADAGVDNSLLFATATTGALGLLAYLYLWFLVIKRANFLRVKNKSIFSLIVISSAIGLFVNSFFINSLFFPSVMIWMWILIGLMETY